MRSAPKAATFTVAVIAAALGVSACNSSSTGASGAGGAYGYGASSGATSSGTAASGYGSSGSTGSSGASGYGSSGYGSSGYGSSGSGSSGSGSSGSGSASGSTGKGGLLKAELTSAGKLLANPHGMTVYYYAEDKPGSGVSSCTGGCATAWPPVLYPVRIPAGLKLPGPLGVIVRPGGIRQVTINGYPIYRYAGDKSPGEATGNGVEGEWHDIKI